MSVPCENCSPDQVCYTPPGESEGTCSWLCADDKDCPNDLKCDTSTGKCVSSSGGGSGDCGDECADDEKCSLAGECVPKDENNSNNSNSSNNSNNASNNANNGGGNNNITPINNGNNSNNSNNNSNNANNGGGGTSNCTIGECGEGKYCNPRPGGECIEPTCGTEGASKCDSQGQFNIYDPTDCRCKQCITDNQCSGDKSCNQNFECSAPCENPCDPQASGGEVCSDVQGMDYCVSGCCAQCVGNTDCPESKACVDGTCQDPPSCTTNADCPTGYACEGDQCAPTSGGGSGGGGSGQQCSGQGDCPQGEFCNPMSGQCMSGSGGGGGGGGLGMGECGFCQSGSNGNCSCPGSLSCQTPGGNLPINVKACFGCQPSQNQCPGQQSCQSIGFLGGGNVCLPFDLGL